MTVYGTAIEPSEFSPLRDLITHPELTGAGNIVIPVGRERDYGDGKGWEKIAHVVLTPEEACEYHAKLGELMDLPHLAERLENVQACLVEIAGEAETLTDNDRNATIFARLEDAEGILDEARKMLGSED